MSAGLGEEGLIAGLFTGDLTIIFYKQNIVV
jgi:hypothetical protein